MRIDGVSRETESHLFVYINRYYSHLIRNAFNDFDQK